jgi:hypothetical protein
MWYVWCPGAKFYYGSWTDLGTAMDQCSKYRIAVCDVIHSVYWSETDPNIT